MQFSGPVPILYVSDIRSSDVSHREFEYGMREFAIEDVNGYVLQFGQEI